jgi:hypothetical protein
MLRKTLKRRTGPSSRRSIIRHLGIERLEARALLAATPVQVMLLVGQSNMGGYGSTSDLRAPYDAPQSDVWIWEDNLAHNVGWTFLRGGFGGDDSNQGSGGDGNQFGPEVSLGRRLADAMPDSQFALIKHVQAGTAATMQDGWNPDRGAGLGPGQIWIDFAAKTHEALAALDASQLQYEVAGLIVSQGNRDIVNETGVEAANYEQNFMHFISGVRQEFGVPQLPVVFAQVTDNQEGTSDHDDWELVRTAQETVDMEDPLATMITTDDLSRLEDLHLDSAGQTTQGQRFANAYLGVPFEGSARPGRDGFETGDFTGGNGQWTAGAWTVSGDASITTSNVPDPILGAHNVRLRNSTGDLVRWVDVTGLSNVKLRFRSKLDSFESVDKAYVKVSGDGTNWATLREFVDGEDTSIYRYYELDVPNLGNTLYVRFHAQMDQSTDNWYIDDVRLAGTTNGVPAPQDPNKFYIVDDGSTDRTYEYGDLGARTDDYSLGIGNKAPRGAATTAAGTRVWIADKNRNVYVYDSRGEVQGLWTAGSLSSNASIEGIATNGSDVWLVDSSADRVYRYTGAANRLSDSQVVASSFALNKSNKSPKDIVTDGTYLWVVDDSTTDKVFKYTLAGALVGSWTITSGGGSPTGITIDLANKSDLWIVDSATDRVYKFAAAASRTSGSQAPATNFALAAGNTNPQGIADPPAASNDLVLTSDNLMTSNKARGGSTIAAPQNSFSFTSHGHSALHSAAIDQLLDDSDAAWTRKSRVKLLV